MNLANSGKRKSCDSSPVFFTGLAHEKKSQKKVPLLCLLCGSSLSKQSINTETFNGCEKCAINFNNLKKALSLLSQSPTEVSAASSNNVENSTLNLKETGSKPLLPKPDESEIAENEVQVSPNCHRHPVRARRKLEFEERSSKKFEQYTFSNSNFVPEDRYEDRSQVLPDCHPHPMQAKRKVGFEESITKKFKPGSFSHANVSEDRSEDRLSKSIWQLFLENKQTKDIYSKKMALRDKLHEILLTRFPTCGLYVVGSSMTGLGANSSDVDMCLMLTDEEIDQEKEATSILHSVRSLFLNFSFLQDVEVIYAKVPIIRFRDGISDIEVDLNVNNSVGIRNTQLLLSYARIDKRLPPLVLLTKMWARYYGINDAKNNTLSSYSIVLMVIHYLQYGCSPPVLPSLQKIQPDKYLAETDVRKLKLFEDLPDYVSENNENVGQLFIGFLKYFAYDFDYYRDVMSVRLGGLLPKEVALNNCYSPKNKRAHWKWVCIEEPFNLTNTACAVFKPGVFRYMKQVFNDSWQRLRKSQNLKDILS